MCPCGMTRSSIWLYTWADKTAYDAQAMKLAEMFRQNFERFADDVPAEIAEAGPQPVRA